MNNFSISELDGINLINNNMENVLSVGISTNGNAEIEMLNKNENLFIIGTTIDKKGIEKTKKIVSDKKIEDRFLLKLEDVRDKDIYEDDSFDYIYARLVLHYLTDSELNEVLKEFRRILKKDGLLYIVVRSDKCDEYINTLIKFDEKTGLSAHVTFTGVVEKTRFHNYETMTKSVTDAGLYIKSIKDYDEVLYADYERTIPVDVRNNLIEVISFK
jgi:predicted SAM-dependent methyltransferase